MSSQPLISVIIPVYNRQRYIAEAIESVLAQDYAPIELIVVDDGSTDGSAAIIQQYGSQLRYIYQENAGLSAARNAGVAASSGHYFAFLDSDDFWTPHKLRDQMAVFSAEPTTDVVYGYAEEFFDDTLDALERSKIKQNDKPISAHIASCMLIRRSLFEQVGPFDTSTSVTCDIEWYTRLLEQKPVIVTLPNVFLKRRIHATNMSRVQRSRKNKAILQTLLTSIHRRQRADTNDA